MKTRRKRAITPAHDSPSAGPPPVVRASAGARAKSNRSIIPFSAPILDGTPVAPVGPRPETVPAHILVVDDDAAMRTMLIESLRGSGYRVSDAEDGEAAWAVLCSDSVDVLITDHDMPRLTGLDLLRRVRAGPLQLPVILISGEMPWNERDLLSLLPPGLALEKPFSLADLHMHVASLLTPRARSRGDDGGQSWLPFGDRPPPLPVRAAG